MEQTQAWGVANMSVNEDRTTITIPYPSQIARTKGIHATQESPQWKVRRTAEEEVIVQEAADFVGVTKAIFIRWMAVQAAKVILKEKSNEYPSQPEFVRIEQ